ncbi:hypothetical protein BV898_16965 [Hypsibius exemplaris]|uniref:Protein kinase domain-containing protein n=1 Tax=Hypsibius exemplaris TaxID=2072580 RepID=A0A9X6NGB8_HYPEX|nr:hypothetical protein BV898_16965 [Hypsibius exemplaris]
MGTPQAVDAIGGETLPPLIPYHELEAKRGARIGTGAFGEVFKIEFMTKTCAVKVFKGAMKEGDKWPIEIRLLWKARSEFVVNVEGISRSPFGDIWMVMGLAEGKSLDEYLHNKQLEARTLPSNESYKWENVIHWLIQCCEGVAYLHRLYIIHRDLKPANILLFQSVEKDGPRWKCRLGDLGVSTDKARDTSRTVNQGTSKYMAPEVMDFDGVETGMPELGPDEKRCSIPAPAPLTTEKSKITHSTSLVS